jgi:hypothetical protein
MILRRTGEPAVSVAHDQTTNMGRCYPRKRPFTNLTVPSQDPALRSKQRPVPPASAPQTPHESRARRFGQTDKFTQFTLLSCSSPSSVPIATWVLRPSCRVYTRGANGGRESGIEQDLPADYREDPLLFRIGLHGEPLGPVAVARKQQSFETRKFQAIDSAEVTKLYPWEKFAAPWRRRAYPAPGLIPRCGYPQWAIHTRGKYS